MTYSNQPKMIIEGMVIHGEMIKIMRKGDYEMTSKCGEITKLFMAATDIAGIEDL